MTEEELFNLVHLIKTAEDERAVSLLKIYGSQEYSRGKFETLEQKLEEFKSLKQHKN